MKENYPAALPCSTRILTLKLIFVPYILFWSMFVALYLLFHSPEYFYYLLASIIILVCDLIFLKKRDIIVQKTFSNMKFKHERQRAIKLSSILINAKYTYINYKYQILKLFALVILHMFIINIFYFTEIQNSELILIIPFSFLIFWVLISSIFETYKFPGLLFVEKSFRNKNIVKIMPFGWYYGNFGFVLLHFIVNFSAFISLILNTNQIFSISIEAFNALILLYYVLYIPFGALLLTAAICINHVTNNNMILEN